MKKPSQSGGGREVKKSATTSRYSKCLKFSLGHGDLAKAWHILTSGTHALYMNHKCFPYLGFENKA